jgi:hypothetical protein
MSDFPQLDLYFQCNPHQNISRLIYEKKMMLKFIRRGKKSQNRQRGIEGELQTDNKATVKTLWSW